MTTSRHIYRIPHHYVTISRQRKDRRRNCQERTYDSVPAVASPSPFQDEPPRTAKHNTRYTGHYSTTPPSRTLEEPPCAPSTSPSALGQTESRSCEQILSRTWFSELFDIYPTRQTPTGLEPRCTAHTKALSLRLNNIRRQYET